MGSGNSLTFEIVISKSVREDEEKRIDAWKGTIGGVGPGGRLEEEANISGLCFDEPVEDPFSSIKERKKQWDGSDVGLIPWQDDRLVWIEILPVFCIPPHDNHITPRCSNGQRRYRPSVEHLEPRPR